jgi:hypothetical protein
MKTSMALVPPPQAVIDPATTSAAVKRRSQRRGLYSDSFDIEDSSLVIGIATSGGRGA